MKRTEKAHYTGEHLRALKYVKDGADVFDYLVAIRLREVERITPSWIKITKAQGKYRAIDTHPYFGAILTPEGIKGLDDACWESLKQPPVEKNERCPTCGEPVISIFEHVDRDDIDEQTGFCK